MTLITAQQAAALVSDGDTVAAIGFGMIQLPEHLLFALERRFLQTGHPRDLTYVHSAGQGNQQGAGIDRFAHEGMLKRLIGGHFRMSPRICQMILDNQFEAYNFPQGVIALLYREIAAKRPGLVTHAGLGTFVDPRLEGGKMTAQTTEELVQVVELAGREWLLYPSFPIDVAFIRMTAADPHGNMTHCREACIMEALALAMAAHNSGGIVVAQVAELLDEPLAPHEVDVPGLYVDHVVVAPPEHHWHSGDREWEPAFLGLSDDAADGTPAVLPLDERKTIARRAATELFDGAIVNLGIGMPEGVASIAAEEGIFDRLHLTIESGTIGGVPAAGHSFGASTYPIAMISHVDQFDFYSGGGLDLAFLGLAEFDPHGNVNVSRFGNIVAGCGGFIEITQNARRIVFCGTLTASGLQAEVGGGQVRIVQEGKLRKATRQVQQVTFSGPEAMRRGTAVLYVTERCVFELRPEGVTLTELAPGVDLQRDVLAQMDFQPLIASDLKAMDPRIFTETRMGPRIS